MVAAHRALGVRSGPGGVLKCAAFRWRRAADPIQRAVPDALAVRPAVAGTAPAAAAVAGWPLGAAAVRGRGGLRRHDQQSQERQRGRPHPGEATFCGGVLHSDLPVAAPGAGAAKSSRLVLFAIGRRGAAGVLSVARWSFRQAADPDGLLLTKEVMPDQGLAGNNPGAPGKAPLQVHAHWDLAAEVWRAASSQRPSARWAEAA